MPTSADLPLCAPWCAHLSASGSRLGCSLPQSGHRQAVARPTQEQRGNSLTALMVAADVRAWRGGSIAWYAQLGAVPHSGAVSPGTHYPEPASSSLPSPFCLFCRRFQDSAVPASAGGLHKPATRCWHAPMAGCAAPGCGRSIQGSRPLSAGQPLAGPTLPGNSAQPPPLFAPALPIWAGMPSPLSLALMFPRPACLPRSAWYSCLLRWTRGWRLESGHASSLALGLWAHAP